MEATLPRDKLGLILKLGLFVLLAIGGMILFPLVLTPAGYLIGAALGTFAAAAVANVISLRVFESRPLSAAGLGWNRASNRHLWIGTAAGMIAAAIAVGLPLLTGLAHWERDPEQPASLPGLLFVTVLLIFGAIGEELLLRGYAFQLLIAHMGAFATILPVSVLFGILHLNNPNARILGIVNTVGFGIVLGYAFLRSGDLWLPIGIHFGWNWTLPLFGVPVSGFKMGVTGFSVRWDAGELWSGGGYGPEASLLTCLVVVLLMVFLVRVPLERQTPYLLSRPKPRENADV